MNRPIDLTLHLGAHKTASSHLQRSILEHREELIAADIRAYGPEYLRDRGRSIPALFGLSPWRGRSVPRRAPLEQLAFLAKDGTRVLLTEENFLGALINRDGGLALPLYHDAAERVAALVEALPGVTIRLFMGIRAPDRFLESAYSQTLFAGQFQQPDAFAAAHPVQVVDWLGIFQRLSDIEGLAEITVWRHEDYHLLFSAIMRRMLRWSMGRQIRPIDETIHAGLSARALQEVIADAAEGKVGDLAVAARRRFPVGPEYPRFSLYSEKERQAAQDDYDRQVAAIRKLPKVTVLRPKPPEDAAEA